MTFAESIKKWREANEVSQEVLSQRLNVDRTTIIKWEKGTIPRYAKLKSVCEELKINCDIYEAITEVELDRDLEELFYVFPYQYDNGKTSDTNIIKRNNKIIGELSDEKYSLIVEIIREQFECLVKKYSL